MPFDPYELLRPAFDADYGTDQDAYRGYVDKYMDAVFKQQKVQQQLDIAGIDPGDIDYARQGIFDLDRPEQQIVNTILNSYAKSYAAKKPLYARPGSAGTGSGNVEAVVNASTAMVPVEVERPRQSVPQGSIQVHVGQDEDPEESAIHTVSASTLAGKSEAEIRDALNIAPDIWDSLTDEQKKTVLLVRTDLISVEERAGLVTKAQTEAAIAAEFGDAEDSSFGRQLSEQESRDAVGTGIVNVDTGGEDAADVAQRKAIVEHFTDAAKQEGISEEDRAEFGYQAYAAGFQSIPGMSDDERDQKLRAQWNSLGQEYEPGSDALSVGIKGYKAFERKDGQEQFRTPANRFGRKISDDVRANMEKVIKAALLRNFDKLITSHTGALRLSVEKGHLEQEQNDDKTVVFVFKLDYTAGNGIDESQLGEGVRPNSTKSSVNARTKQAYGKGPEFYGPIVFAGRREIISRDAMKFKTERTAGGWVQTRHVGAASARDITTMEQRDIINFADAISSAYARKLFDALVSQAAYDFKKADD